MRGSFMENMENFGQKLSLNAYAMKILSEHGCDCYTYGDEDAKHILEDLKTAYPNGMEYPYIEVANEILKMDSKTAKWIARDAIKELESEDVQNRLSGK